MFWLPIIAGATIGALTNKDDPIKGAVIGGTLGAAGGTALGAAGVGGAGASGAAGAGGASGVTSGLLGASSTGAAGSGLTASAVPTSAGMGLGASAPGATAFEASMGLPNSAFIANGGSLGTALGGRASQMGMSTIGSGSTLYRPEYYANVLGNPVYTGNESLLSQVGTGANSIFDTAKSELGEYATPQNLIGVGNSLNNINAAPRIVSPGGGVKGGGAVNYEPLSNVTVQKRKRRGNA